jgi:hemin uptake protein HemP
MKISFWLRSRKTQKIVHFRIIVDGEQLNVSTGIAAKPEHWLGSDNLFNPLNKVLIEHNNSLSQTRAELLRAYNDIRAERRMPTASMVLERFYKNKHSYNPIVAEVKIPTIEFIMQKVMCYKKMELEEKALGLRTYERYVRFQKHFTEYLSYKKTPVFSDITKIDEIMMRGFFSWLSNVREYKNSYINKYRDYIIMFREMAHKHKNHNWQLDWIQRDIPDLPEDEPELVFLEPNDLKKVETLVCHGKLEKVQDMFLFMVETGVHIVDYRGLRKLSTINQDLDGKKWVAMQRQKTKVKFRMIVTLRAMEIINKYGGTLSKLPIMDDQKYNELLKILGYLSKIDVELTSKVARKTFCNLHLNYKGTSKESTAEVLGLTGTLLLKRYGVRNWETTKQGFRKTS